VLQIQPSYVYRHTDSSHNDRSHAHQLQMKASLH